MREREECHDYGLKGGTRKKQCGGGAEREWGGQRWQETGTRGEETTSFGSISDNWLEGKGLWESVSREKRRKKERVGVLENSS